MNNELQILKFLDLLFNEMNLYFSEAALSSPYLSADLMPSFDSEEIERDDFEIISEAELAEAMRK